jgi:tRNA pseudouridine55 synthase
MDLKNKNKTYDFMEGEVLLINKPSTWTSFDVVNKIRRMLGYFLKVRKIKVGHAGTLDPLATGLLIVCTGGATKNIQQFQDMDKEYTGTFYLGATTASLDKETDIEERHPVDHISEDMIRQASRQFTGTIEQVPPAYSAIKIEGTRAYHMAREKQKVSMAPRKVHISSFEITAIQMPFVEFRVSCSKGTYIRSLARDFGNELNTGAYLEELCRTRIGSYELADAMEIAELENILRQMQQSA